MELDELFSEVAPRIKKDERLPLQEGEKFCNGCKTVKPITEFNDRTDRGSADRYGKVARCRVCTTAAAKEYYYRDHEKSKERGRRVQYLRRHEGRITEEEAAKLSKNNVGYCDLCSSYGIIYIDHDHRTEARRGFLCYSCNTGLGNFKDNITVMQKAIAYLQRYKDE